MYPETNCNTIKIFRSFFAVIIFLSSAVGFTLEDILHPISNPSANPIPNIIPKFTKEEFKQFQSAIKAGIGNFSYIAGVASGSPSCTQKPPVDLKILHRNLPPEFAQIITEKNYNLLLNLYKTAQLAASASTGEPFAIMRFVLFLASPDSPVVPVMEVAEKMLPYVIKDFSVIVTEANKLLNSPTIRQQNEQLQTFGEALAELETTTMNYNNLC